MKTRYWLIIIVVICLSSSAGSYFVGRKSCTGKPTVIYETKTVTEYVPAPPNLEGQQLCEWYEQCQKSEMKIKGEFDIKSEFMFNVTASDQCKHAHKSFNLALKQKITHNEIGIGPGLLLFYDVKRRDLIPLVGGVFQYTRWWGNIGLMAPVKMYGAIDSSAFAAGLDLMVNYRW